MILESLAGGIVGGLMRLAPEVLKVLDRKNERKHETEMTKLSIEQIKVQGSIRMDEKAADVTLAQIGTMTEALRGQAQMAVAGGKVSSFISSLVRPLVTYWLLGLYSFAKVAQIRAAHAVSGDVFTAVQSAYSVDDMALFSGILTFWFVNRIYTPVRSR